MTDDVKRYKELTKVREKALVEQKKIVNRVRKKTKSARKTAALLDISTTWVVTQTRNK
jgi:hypothetical protein